MDVNQASLDMHYELGGKIEIVSRKKIETREDLSLAYTPGVAEPCRVIAKDYEQSFKLTRRSNLVAVITDGTAVLGLGDIGPAAGMPVMEGKCVLFKEFADVDAFPLCIDSKDTDTIVQTIYLISKSFGGINLEDIAAPRCFEIERRLKELCDIPVFHDDQHGTAVVSLAALINSLKLVKKNKEDIKVVINGAGAAGIAIGKMLLAYGVKDVTMVDRFGIICQGDEGLNSAHEEISKVTNRSRIKGKLSDAMKGADVFIGVSAPDCVSKDMVSSMADKAIVFTCANPIPEIQRADALAAGAYIVGTGSSEHPNQINNVLVFPGLFRGALDVRATTVNREMMIAAAEGIASCVSDQQLSPDYILPYAYDKTAHECVARAVAKAARDTGVAKIR